ncbi:exported hypothetical protein [Arthrobacter sp. 9V]|nr:exported hypothetical protein [Arthrobacter sp. 9V]
MVPILMVPALFSFSMVVPASKLAEATGGVVVLLPPPQALSEMASAADAATRSDFLRVIRDFMVFLSLGGRLTAGGAGGKELVGQELGQEVLGTGALRVGEEFFGGGVLHDLTVGHEHHAVSGLAGKAHLVGDHDHGHAFFGQLDHDVQHFVDHFGVQRGRWLVEQHHFRLHGKSTGNSHTLLLAAGELGGKLRGLVSDAYTLKEGHGFFVGRALGHLLDLDGAQCDVLKNRLVGEQVEGLEDHSDVGTQVREVLAFFGKLLPVDGDVAVVDGFQAVDCTAKSGFTGTGRSNDHHDFTLLNLKVDVFEDMQLTVVLIDAVQGDEGIAGRLSSHTTNLANKEANMTTVTATS